MEQINSRDVQVHPPWASYMGWTKRRKEKIITGLLVTATLAIIAIGVLVAFTFPKVTWDLTEKWP
jgi:hypothetical protein